jgi:phage-related protein
MAIGLAFVDIVGDTSRTADQVEQDMNRVLTEVQQTIDPVEVQAAVESGTEQDLVRTLNQDIRAAQAAIAAVQVDARLSPETQQALTAGLRQTISRAQARISEVRVRVDARELVEETEAALAQAAGLVRIANVTMPELEIEADVENVRRDLSGIAAAASSALGPVTSLSAGLLKFGAAVPSLFAIATTLQSMGPAAAIAAPAILAVQSATGAFKLAAVGVKDAVSAAFDPSDPEAYAEALKRLSPEARQFVGALKQLQPQLKQLQQGVQNRVFDGFAESLKDLSKTVLPEVSASLLAAGTSLNQMGLGAAAAASDLGKDGTLGTALAGTREALQNLVSVPGQVTKAFGQLAAAAAPQFEALTAGAAKGAASISERLTAAFQSGGLQRAFDAAIDQVFILFDVLGNVGEIIGNITSEAQGFQGALSVLQQVTQAIADFTATDTAQKAFRALFETVNLLVTTALPILSVVLKAVGGVIVAIQPGVNALVAALGDALLKVVSALGPVLVSVARAVGALVVAIAPLIVVAGELIAALLPVLVPILNGLTTIFEKLTPVIQTVADTMAAVLLPIFAELPGLVQPFVDLAVELTNLLLPLFTDLLVELQPALLEVSRSFVTVAQALAPVLVQFAQLAAQILREVIPIMPPIINLVGRLAAVLSGELATQINQIAIPALKLLTSVLDGDVKGAAKASEELFKGLAKTVVRAMTEIPGEILSLLGEAAIAVFKAGSQIILSLINGIKSKLGELKDVLSNVTDLIPKLKGPAERDRKLLTPAGEMIMDGLIRGIASRVPALEGQLGSITSMVGSTGGAINVGVGGVPVPASASGFAAPSAPRGGASTVPNVQVFIGDQQLTDIVDVRIASVDQFQARQLMTGFRR